MLTFIYMTVPSIIIASNVVKALNSDRYIISSQASCQTCAKSLITDSIFRLFY